MNIVTTRAWLISLLISNTRASHNVSPGMTESMEIGGLTILPGAPVSVKWLESWYEGEILEMGHQKDLFKIKDSSTGLVVLLEKSQFKVIDTSKPTHEQFSQGSEIAYYDNGMSGWLTGTIEDLFSEESILVKWKRESEPDPNVNWFQPGDVAPIIPNEAFKIEADDEKIESKTHSKIQLPSMTKEVSLKDVLDERPRHRKNSMYVETMNAVDHQPMPFQNRLPTYDKFVEDLNSQHHVKGHRTSVSMKRYYSDTFTSPTSQNKDHKLERYLQKQAALLHGKVDHSLMPPVWSYIGRARGIPHHPSSRFFRHVRSASRLPNSSGQYYGSQGWIRSYGHQPVKRTKSEQFQLSKSPTMISDPNSEPSPYAQLIVPGGKSRALKRQDMSNRPLPALPDDEEEPANKSMMSSPYEVPLPLSSPASWTNLQQRAQPNNYSSRLESLDEISNTDPDIKAPTIVSTSKSEMMVSAGGTVTLFCEANSDTPVTFEWTKNGQKLTNNDDRVAFPSPGTLQLYGLCINDAGLYQCTVINQGGAAIYKCNLYVEEESLKRSFSREDNLDKMAKNMPGFDTLQRELYTVDNQSLPSVSDPDDNFHSQAPAYDDYPLNMVRHTLSLASMGATIQDIEDQDAALFMETPPVADKVAKKEKKKSKKESTKDRKMGKDKRKRVSNVLMNEVQDYLGGYGEDYGQNTDEMMLANGITSEKQGKKDKKSSKKAKKEKKSKKHKEKEPIEETNASMLVQTDPSPPVHKIAVEDTDDIVAEGMVRETEEAIVADDVASAGGQLSPLNQLKGAHSHDSIDAHPSFESLLDDDNEESDGEGQAEEGEEQDRVSLPQEMEHYSEGVRRLQQSSQEYEEQHFGKDDRQKSNNKRRGPFSKLFKGSSKDENKLTVI